VLSRRVSISSVVHEDEISIGDDSVAYPSPRSARRRTILGGGGGGEAVHFPGSPLSSSPSRRTLSGVNIGKTNVVCFI